MTSISSAGPASRARLSIIIVAHDSLADLRAALPPLLAELDPEDEVIVVDSGSCDGLAGELEHIAPPARLITAPGNVGFAAGANLGGAAAQGELIVLLNPDARVQRGWSQAIRAPWGGPWAGWMALV
ncbi:MAG TPA: glycosyltransferase, partial [Solirubrobacteraceae bacterium]